MTASVSPTGGVYIGLGANLPSGIGPPRETLEETVRRIAGSGIEVVRVSPWYESEPVPPSDQPWFVNGVAELRTALRPAALLAVLHGLERDLGRIRRVRWEARVVDLDLLDYRGIVDRSGPPRLPHPRVAERPFVLLPLRDIAPRWRHPETGEGIDASVAALPAGGGIVRRAPESGGMD